MTKYLNIVTSSKSTRHLNVSGTTAVLQSNHYTSFYDAEGTYFGHEDKDAPLDAAQIVADMQSLQPGKVFVPVELLDHEDKLRGAYYIDPAAVTFMTVSMPETRGPGAGLRGIIIGVEGVGYVETRINQSALTTLMDAVRDAGKNLLALDASEAYARWSVPETLYVDPASITRIRQDGGGQLWTEFKNSGELDIQIAKIDDQKIYQDLIAKSPELSGNFNQVAGLVRTEERKQENAALARLAQKMSLGNDALLHIPSNTHALYLQPEDVRAVQTLQRDDGKHQLYIEFKKTLHDRYGKNASLFFETAPECDATLQILMTGKPSVKAVKPVPTRKK